MFHGFTAVNLFLLHPVQVPIFLRLVAHPASLTLQGYLGNHEKGFNLPVWASADGKNQREMSLAMLVLTDILRLTPRLEIVMLWNIGREWGSILTYPEFHITNEESPVIS